MKKTSVKAISALLLVVLLLSFFMGATFFKVQGKRINASAKEISSSASGMVTMEALTGRVLYSKNMHQRLAPASTTKILTAIVVLENTKNSTTPVLIPDKAVGIEGSSVYLQRGERLSIKDLLYGLMLQSGNDCAEALAILTAGSKEKFAALMNETAKRIGAKNSNFVTPSGLDEGDHYTTAYDLGLISCYAMQNEAFREIVNTKVYKTSFLGKDYPRIINNKNRLLNMDKWADGIKTGYTKKAGRTFVGSSTKDGMTVVCVVLNCGPMFEECKKLLNTAHQEYSLITLLEEGVTLTSIFKDNKKVYLGVLETVEMVIEKEKVEKLTLEYQLDSFIPKVKILVDKELLLERELVKLSRW